MWLTAGMVLGLLLGRPVAVLAEEGESSSLGEGWDRRYSVEHFVYGAEPVAFLKDQIGRLGRGRALCLAAGEGRNAVYLAQQGFEVVAVDISAKGLEKCAALARERGVEVQTVVADLREYNMGRSRYDLITDFYYYDPKLFPGIMAALKPGGVFIMQNFSLDQLETNRFGPRDPAFLIEPGEVLDYFAPFRIRYYEDTVVELDEGMHRASER